MTSSFGSTKIRLHVETVCWGFGFFFLEQNPLPTKPSFTIGFALCTISSRLDKTKYTMYLCAGFREGYFV